MTAILASLVLFAGTLDRDTSIRSTDWKKFFLSDTANFSVDTTMEDYGWGNLFIQLKKFEEGSLAYGYPIIGYGTFGDLDGDNVEEAAVSFYTGGSIGSCSYVILKKTSNGVKVCFQDANCVGARIENDTLNLYDAYPTGYDYDRMAQSVTQMSYRLREGALTLLDSQAYGLVRFAGNAVTQFYKRLRQKDYEAAYELLSPRYQSLNPYQKWLRGFIYTDSTSADISSIHESDTTVAVKISSLNAIDSNIITANYSGTWKLIWGGLDRGWLLDEPKIRKVK